MLGQNPYRRLVLKIALLVFFAELAVMLVIPEIAGHLQGWRGALLDAFLLISMVGPLVLWRVSAWSTRGASDPAPVRAGWFSGPLPVLGVLAVGVPLSLAFAWALGRQIDRTAQSRFEAIVLNAERSLQDWVYRPIYGMHGARGVFVASDSVSPAEFARYVASRDLPREFPGVGQLGFLVPESERPAPVRWSVRHAEPSLVSGLAPGDPVDDPRLISILRESVERQANRLTPPIDLPLGDGSVRSMLWLVPVYTNGAPCETSEQRWSALAGVLIATFDPGALSAQVTPALGGMATLDVIAGLPDEAPGHFLFGMGESLDGSRAGAPDPTSSTVPFEHETRLEIGGQSWTLRFRSTPAFDAGISRDLPTFVATGGIAITALVAGLLHAMSSGRRRALRLANEMTERVRTLSAVATNTSNAVIITDAEQRITWVNQGFTDITGYTFEECVGRKPGSFLQFEKTDPETRRAIREAIGEGRGFSGEIPNRAKDGREYWLGVDIQPVRDDAGTITGFIAVESDLTELKQAKLEAERANEAKSRFLSSMSHEIRTPLNGIIGFAELLQRGADAGDEATRAEWIGIIHGSGEHLLSLLNDVLDLSKLDADKMDIGLAPCNPRSVVADAVLLLRSRADEKGIALTERFDDSVPAAIRSDKTRIRQIVMNLVSNAVKFTKQGGVSVTTSARGEGDDRRLVIEVRDSGIGMSEEQVRNLFNPFQQGDRTITDDFGGTGLGLSISRDLARKMGGDITVRSAPGIGSVFTVTLAAHPLLPGEALPNPLPTRDPWVQGDGQNATPLEGARVLVADDVEANRKVARMFLTRAGAEVTTVDDGEQAVAEVEKSRFDLVLMDVQMPRMSGLDATRRIRSAGHTMPILALTAFSSGGDRASCLDAGMNDFLAKPFETAVLIQTTARWIRMNETGFPRGSADQERAAEPEAPPTLNLEEFRADRDLAEVAIAWLAELPEKLDRAERAIRDGDYDTVAAIGHAVHGSGESLGMPGFTAPASELDAAGRTRDADAANDHLRALRAVHADAIARLSTLAA